MQFPSTSPWGAYIWRRDLTEGFLRYEFEGLIYGGACTWGGLSFEIFRYLPEKILVKPPGRVGGERPRIHKDSQEGKN